MEGLLFLFGLFLALGLFFLTASVLKLPTMGAAKAMLGTVKQERKAAKTLETYFMILAVRLSGFIRMDAYKRSRMQNVLKASGMNMTPEVYQAYALVKSGAVLLGAIPCIFLFPLLVPVVVVLALLLYFKENQKADEMLEIELDGKIVPAMVYVMTPGHSFGIPSDYYSNVIWQGYETAGFETQFLEDAIEHAYQLVQKQEREGDFYQQSLFHMGGYDGMK